MYLPLILFSYLFLVTVATFIDNLTCSFLVLYVYVTPHIHRSIITSFTSMLLSWPFVVAHVSAPYTIAVLDIVFLYTGLKNLKDFQARFDMSVPL